MASERWNTHRGDEWWFSSGSAVADGSYNSAASMFEITRVSRGGDQPMALHHLLHQTIQEFKGSKVLVVLDSSTRSALEALSATSDVVWQEFRQPFSLWAHILGVVPPNNSFKPKPLRGSA
jgi:hypothetical protein